VRKAGTECARSISTAAILFKPGHTHFHVLTLGLAGDEGMFNEIFSLPLKECFVHLLTILKRAAS
jgi:hypothetical protein